MSRRYYDLCLMACVRPLRSLWSYPHKTVAEWNRGDSQVNGIKLYSAAVVVALVPAVVGLVGNRSFSESVPVRIPEQVSSTPEATTPSPSPAPLKAKATKKPETQDDHGRRHGGHGADDGPGPDHRTTSVGDDRGDDGNDDHGRNRRGHDGPDNSGPSEANIRDAGEDRLDDIRDAREDRLDDLRDAREDREERLREDSSGPGSGDDDEGGGSSGPGSGD